MIAIHVVDFEILREKGDFLKTTIGNSGLIGGSNIVYDVGIKYL